VTWPKRNGIQPVKAVPLISKVCSVEEVKEATDSTLANRHSPGQTATEMLMAVADGRSQTRS